MAALFAPIDHLSRELSIRTTVGGQKPLLVADSSTASANVRLSVPWPWLLAPLYSWLLAAPYADKLKMEKLVYADKGAHLRDVVISM